MTAAPIEEFATETVPARTRVELDEQQITDMGLLGPALLSGPANVIMQLSHPAVGYGVYESKVDSGNLYKHPVKRTRTTLTYLAVAATGGPELRRKYRQAVNRSHVQVRSVESSPVKYNAFDPELQLWVAACLYRGWEDCVRIFGDEADLTEEAYRQGAVMGTTLQMPPEMWPATRADFEVYWNSVLDEMVIDDVIGSYLKSIVRLEFASPVLRVLMGRFSEILTIGFLPPEFREKIGFTQTKTDKLIFDLHNKILRGMVHVMPKSWRQFPFNLLLADLKWRMTTNRPLI
ncbi:oxygenase MpaB family protein [Gordonia liuliyuniae]|uniref:Oxygenase MpaB family protein n=1 Tax=Gordonia liuliyuniae TaxID=2911517 RepID=A0ABS9IP84_9ACTN|nr:oxygenase MpaB family protein [Gordonia liuliyuniae]MCF8587385.1 oxygenase MpaB family protein [Gordonia liuliyuniae]